MKRLLAIICVIMLLASCASSKYYKGCDGKRKFKTNMQYKKRHKRWIYMAIMALLIMGTLLFFSSCASTSGCAAYAKQTAVNIAVDEILDGVIMIIECK